MAHFGNVSIVGVMVGALPREGARGRGARAGRGFWESGEFGGRAPLARRTSCLRAQGWSPALRSRARQGSPRGFGSLWRSAPSGGGAGRSSASSPSTLSRPGKFAWVSDFFVEFPLGHRAPLSPLPGTRAGRGLSGSTWRRPADTAASSLLGGSGLSAQDHSGPRPFPEGLWTCQLLPYF